MRTDDLIALIAADDTEVRGLGRLVLFGALGTFALVLAMVTATIGVRADVASIWRVPDAILKHASLIALAAALSLAFLAALKPGVATRRPLTWALGAVAIVAAVATVELARAPLGGAMPLVFGRNWLACLVFVPSFAVLPFVLAVAAARRGAPTDLRFAGMVAGLAAGALSGAAYALHCTDDAAPFLFSWYGLAILACGAVGRMLGPRLLRW